MDVEIEASSVPDTVSECGTNDSDTSESTSSISQELEIPDLQKLVDQTPQDDPNLPGYQQRLGEALIDRYRDEGNLPDLQVAVKHLQEAVRFTSEGHPDRARRLQNLSVSLIDRYQQLGDLSDLEAALQARQGAVELTPEGHPDRARCLQNLSVSLADRYRRLGDLSDLEAALQADQEAVGLTPEGHPERPGRLQGLAVSFTDRYRRLGVLSDLEAALQANQEAVGLTTEGHPDRARCLRNLSVSLTDRYRRLGDLSDLEAALQADQEAVGLTPEGHPERPGHLEGLAEFYGNRYQRLGDLGDLEAALQASQEAVGLTPEGHPQKPGRLEGLAASYRNRYLRLGDLGDLEAALQTYQGAVGLTPEGHHRPGRLRGHAMSLTYRYQRLGDLSDLEAALQANQEAVGLTPDGHPDMPDHLAGLAVSYGNRYQRLGDLGDLEAAFQATQEAVGLTPEGHPDRAKHLQNHSVSLTNRYQQLGDLSDLEVALQADQEAVGLTPEGHPSRPGRLQGLAMSFTDRYRRLGALSDLEAALQANQGAVRLTPEGHPDRARRLQSLAVSLTDRYQRLGDLSDLEAALQADQEAVGLTPEGHPDRASHLQNLAVSFTERYRKFGRPHDLERIHTNYTLSFQMSSSTPQSSWTAALRWASVSQEFQSAHDLTAYSNAFKLLPDILWLGNLLTVRHEATHRLGIEQATSSAARAFITHSQYSSAVEIIEQGVGITFQQMLQLKTDMDGLPSSQAQKLQLLSAELYSGRSSNPKDVANQRQKLLEDIRQQPGLEHFLLPKPYKILSRASQGGPVVILTSHQNHCEGIIILDPASDPVHVSLPNVTLALLKSQQETLQQLLRRRNVRTREESVSTRLFGRHELFESKTVEECFTDILTWLYTNVVAPVYQVLELHGVHNGRLWWLPTGVFTGLPLHACSPTNDFIHSYTATLGSLLDAYSRKLSNPPKVGIVGVTHTSSRANHLPGVEQEVKKILCIIKTAPVQCLEGLQATPDAVKLQLQDCSWIHLACHGTQNLLEPTKSRLLLYQGVLELETILRMDLSTAEFVFLAACQTAMGDSQLVNESFHLGGGFIAAGFRSAIGTLWSMNDWDGPLVAEKLYSHLFREGRQPQASDTAEALQLAVQELKAQKVPYERWIPFIHMGI
ncbi:CHAT domain-containing protein [Mycena vulgaris]|nr:CHAT domain-containing protein [Mycena vulgaris]